ncbi:MAG TPA: hypothetical protein VMR94_02810 [Hyphomicrobiaceae bacterium]|nr:hypothetical protein [Hyphomicrobiaceae bacterium]
MEARLAANPPPNTASGVGRAIVEARGRGACWRRERSTPTPTASRSSSTPLVKAFADETGIKTNIAYAPAGLNDRLAAEGHNSPADPLFTVDAGRLSEVKDAGKSCGREPERGIERLPP